MPINKRNLEPKFRLGEQVSVTFPGIYRGKEGLVMEVMEHHGDFVHRYRIRFDDSTVATFFEFELAPTERTSSHTDRKAS